MFKFKNNIFLGIIFFLQVIFIPKIVLGQEKLDSILTKIDTISLVENKIQFLNEKAFEYVHINLSIAKYLAEYADSLAENSNKAELQGNCSNTLGIIAHSSGDYKNAVKHYYKAIRIWKTENDTGWLSATYNNLGIVYYLSGDYKKALEQYLTALNYSISFDSPTGLSSTYNNIGIVLDLMGETDKAFSYYQKSLKISKEENDKRGIATAYNNIGEIFKTKQNYDSALFYYSRALKANSEIGRLSGVADAYLNFGDVARMQKKYDLAFKNYFKAENYYNQIGDTITTIELELSKAQTYFEKKEYDEALNCVNTELDKAIKIGSLEHQKSIFLLKSKCYENLKNYPLALTEFKNFALIKDSISQKEVKTKLSNFELKYQFDKEKNKIELESLKAKNKAEHEIANQKRNRNLLISILILFIFIIAFIYKSNKTKKEANIKLTLKNQQVNEQAEELKQTLHQLSIREQQLLDTNKTKDRMFSIIGHDLRGPVGSLQKLLEILTEQFNFFKDDEIKEMLITAKESSQQTFNLLENLLLWARSQKHEVKFLPQMTSILPLVEENIKLLKGTAEIKGISILNKVQTNCTAFCDSDAINTIIRNLLSNAIKFTPEGGTIQMNCEIEKDFLVFKIKDSGVGIKQEILDKLFNENEIVTTYGTNNEKGTGLGLKLCNDLVKLNKGFISVDTKANIGSTFIIKLPLKERT